MNHSKAELFLHALSPSFSLTAFAEKEVHQVGFVLPILL